MRLNTFAYWYDRALGAFVFFLMIATTVIVLLGIFYRYVLNDSLTWYDEVSEFMLVWLTYYGAAYAALKRQHIGFGTFVRMLPPRARLRVLMAVEVLVLGFWVLMVWIGFVVFQFLEYETMVSLDYINMRVPYSAMPFGAALYVLSELLNLPRILAEARGELSPAVVTIGDEVL
jgi:TRAP-type C4-dicarboxylate transport system permease small subunit